MTEQHPDPPPRQGRTIASDLVRGIRGAERAQAAEAGHGLALEELEVLLLALDQSDIRIRARNMPAMVQAILKLQAQRDVMVAARSA